MKCKCEHDEKAHGRLGCSDCGCRAFSYADPGGGEPLPRGHVDRQATSLDVLTWRAMANSFFANEPMRVNRRVARKVHKLMEKLGTLHTAQVEALLNALEP